MSTQLVALPSYYGETLFRSRLEARWAAYFDLIECPWQYEPEGFALPEGNYCPDFFCPARFAAFFVEAKPTIAELGVAKPKLQSLARLSHHCVYGVIGPPSLDAQWHAYPSGLCSGSDANHRGAVFAGHARRGGAWGVPYLAGNQADWLDEWDYKLAAKAANLRFENGRASRLSSPVWQQVPL